MTSNKKLERIKVGLLSRGSAMARLTLSTGARAASYAIGNLFAQEEDKPQRYKHMLQEQFTMIAKELGELKGSLMKAGQMLSVYGEHFFPPEVNALLKTLHNQSPPVAWHVIKEVLETDIPQAILDKYDLEQEHYASASLGQVYRATRKADGLQVAVKIQYPGIDKAIDSDIKTIRRLLSLSHLLPKSPVYDAIFLEVKQMLEQELDYRQERLQTEFFAQALADDPRYVVPRCIDEMCSKRVLTTTFETGHAVDSPQVLQLSQDRRNKLGITMLELLMREIWQFKRVQTDPHFGNFHIRLGSHGMPDKLVIFDFGAVRMLPQPYLDAYVDLVQGSLQRDAARVVRGGVGLGYLPEAHDATLTKALIDLCFLFLEPFYDATTEGVQSHLFDADGNYNWGASDLPRRIARKGAQAALMTKLQPPPPESIFVDRKLAGVFIFLSTLQVQLCGRPIIEKYLPCNV